MYSYSDNYNNSLYDKETSIRDKSPYRNKSHISKDNFRTIKTPLPRRCPPVIRDKDVEEPPKYSSSWSAFFAEKTLAKLKEIIKQRTEREEFLNKEKETEADPEDRELQVSEIKEKLFKAVDNIQYEPEKREIKDLIEQIIYSGEEKEVKKAIEAVVYASGEQALEEAVRQVDDREATNQVVDEEKNYTEGTSLYSDELHHQPDCPIEKDSNEIEKQEISEAISQIREEDNSAEDTEIDQNSHFTSEDVSEESLESIMENESDMANSPENGGEFGQQPFPEELPEMPEPFGGF